MRDRQATRVPLSTLNTPTPRDSKTCGSQPRHPGKCVLRRVLDDEPATKLQRAPEAGWAHSIPPRGDIQYLMGDDLLGPVAIKALLIIGWRMASHRLRGTDQIKHDICLQDPEDEDKKDEMIDEEDIYGAQDGKPVPLVPLIPLDYSQLTQSLSSSGLPLPIAATIFYARGTTLTESPRKRGITRVEEVSAGSHGGRPITMAPVKSPELMEKIAKFASSWLTLFSG